MSRVKKFDLTKNQTILKNRMPETDQKNDKMMRELRSLLTKEFRDSVFINHLHDQTILVEDYLNTLPVPACISIFEISGKKGFVYFDHHLLESLIELNMGGSTKREQGTHVHSLTTVERVIIERMMGLFLVALSTGQSNECSLSAIEDNSQIVSLSTDSSQMQLEQFQFECGSYYGEFAIVLPFH